MLIRKQRREINSVSVEEQVYYDGMMVRRGEYRNHFIFEMRASLLVLGVLCGEGGMV